MTSNIHVRSDVAKLAKSLSDLELYVAALTGIMAFGIVANVVVLALMLTFVC